MRCDICGQKECRGGELQEEITTLRAQLEQERARVAELEAENRYLRVRDAELISFMWQSIKTDKATLKAVAGHMPDEDAWLLRKQAEAVEAAAKECMPGPCGPPDDPPAGHQEYCEGVASVRDYAQRLRNQANESEKGGK